MARPFLFFRAFASNADLSSSFFFFFSFFLPPRVRIVEWYPRHRWVYDPFFLSSPAQRRRADAFPFFPFFLSFGPSRERSHYVTYYSLPLFFFLVGMFVRVSFPSFSFYRQEEKRDIRPLDLPPPLFYRVARCSSPFFPGIGSHSPSGERIPLVFPFLYISGEGWGEELVRLYPFSLPTLDRRVPSLFFLNPPQKR